MIVLLEFVELKRFAGVALGVRMLPVSLLSVFFRSETGKQMGNLQRHIIAFLEQI